MFEVDLLSCTKVTKKWTPQFLRRQYWWKIFSGKWKLESPNKIRCLRDPKVKTGENISIIGSPSWKDFVLQVRFKLLSNSLKPPEGGAVLYFLFKNNKNYYSFHFCLFKQKIEFIKRTRGVWITLAEQAYEFETQKDYFITISTSSGIHQCQLDGTNPIATCDSDISKGCIGIGAKYCDVEFSHVSVSIPSRSIVLRRT